MKKTLLFAFVLILTACSAQPQVISTLPPTSIPLPTSTETPVPTITPTSIPTLAAFSPEIWAGTDQVRLDFLATLDSLGYPRENITCDADGACFDLDGSQIGKNGVFNQKFVEEVARENAINTGLEPETGNVAPGTPTNKVVEYVGGTGLIKRARDENKAKDLGFDFGVPGKGKYQIILLSEENRSWAVSFTRDNKDPSAPEYFIYETESNAIVIVRTD